MKKLSALVIASVLTFALAACTGNRNDRRQGQDGTADNQTTGTTTTNDPSMNQQDQPGVAASASPGMSDS